MKNKFLVLPIYLFITFQIQGQSATQLFQEGRDAFSDKLFSRSIESFREFLDQYPSDPRGDQAGYMIGVSFFYQKKFSQAISYFDQYEKDFPGSAYLSRTHY